MMQVIWLQIIINAIVIAWLIVLSISQNKQRQLIDCICTWADEIDRWMGNRDEDPTKEDRLQSTEHKAH